MLKLARLGVSIFPLLPAFYNEPRIIDDLVDYTVTRALDQFGLHSMRTPRWDGTLQHSSRYAEDVAGVARGRRSPPSGTESGRDADPAQRERSVTSVRWKFWNERDAVGPRCPW